MTEFQLLMSPQVAYAAVPRHIQEAWSNAPRPDLSKDDTLNCSITAVNPIILDEVILVALSQPAYTFAQTERESLEQQLYQDRRILRQGTQISLNNKCEYKIVMTMPAHQGYIDPQTTQIIVVAGASSTDYDLDDSPTSSSTGLETGDDLDSDIDETFLLNSALGTDTSARALTKGIAAQFYVKLLQSSRWLPRDQFQDVTVFVRTADLARLGVFSGDWVSQ
jgi:hypothetical protein